MVKLFHPLNQENVTFTWQKAHFLLEIGYLLKLKILVPISQFFTILGIGYHFLFIF